MSYKCTTALQAGWQSRTLSHNTNKVMKSQVRTFWLCSPCNPGAMEWGFNRNEETPAQCCCLTNQCFKKYVNRAGCSDLRLHSQHFGRMRWVDYLKSGVQDQLCQHGKTISLLKNKDYFGRPMLVDHKVRSLRTSLANIVK